MEPFDSDQPCWVMVNSPRAGGRGVRTAAAHKASARAAVGDNFIENGDSSQRERKDRTPFGTLISINASSPYRNLSAGAPAVVLHAPVGVVADAAGLADDEVGRGELGFELRRLVLAAAVVMQEAATGALDQLPDRKSVV